MSDWQFVDDECALYLWRLELNDTAWLSAYSWDGKQWFASVSLLPPTVMFDACDAESAKREAARLMQERLEGIVSALKRETEGAA